jgi:hypothetical protein
MVAAVGDHLRAAGCTLSFYDPRLTRPSSTIDVAYWRPRADVRATPSEVNHDFAFPGAQRPNTLAEIGESSFILTPNPIAREPKNSKPATPSFSAIATVTCCAATSVERPSKSPLRFAVQFYAGPVSAKADTEMIASG